MSKSTQKYGHVTLHAHTSIDAHPVLPVYILNQHRNLDAVAQEKYGLKYDQLDNSRRLLVHETVKDRKRGKQQQADLREAELDYADTLEG